MPINYPKIRTLPFPLPKYLRLYSTVLMQASSQWKLLVSFRYKQYFFTTAAVQTNLILPAYHFLSCNLCLRLNRGYVSMRFDSISTRENSSIHMLLTKIIALDIDKTQEYIPIPRYLQNHQTSCSSK